MFKSEAHKLRCQQLVKDKKLTQEKYDEMEKATVGKLPDRAPSKTKTGVRQIRRVR